VHFEIGPHNIIQKRHYHSYSVKCHQVIVHKTIRNSNEFYHNITWCRIDLIIFHVTWTCDNLSCHLCISIIPMTNNCETRIIIPIELNLWSMMYKWYYIRAHLIHILFHSDTFIFNLYSLLHRSFTQLLQTFNTFSINFLQYTSKNSSFGL